MSAVSKGDGSIFVINIDQPGEPILVTYYK